eukprot:scaffold52888_cov70-Phaeocystis_antarctica.AAC.22
MLPRRRCRRWQRIRRHVPSARERRGCRRGPRRQVGRLTDTDQAVASRCTAPGAHHAATAVRGLYPQEGSTIKGGGKLSLGFAVKVGQGVRCDHLQQPTCKPHTVGANGGQRRERRGAKRRCVQPKQRPSAGPISPPRRAALNNSLADESSGVPASLPSECARSACCGQSEEQTPSSTIESGATASAPRSDSIAAALSSHWFCVSAVSGVKSGRSGLTSRPEAPQLSGVYNADCSAAALRRNADISLHQRSPLADGAARTSPWTSSIAKVAAVCAANCSVRAGP